jgi:hypothetical protein
MAKTDITPAFTDIFSIQKNKCGRHLSDPSRPGLIEHIVLGSKRDHVSTDPPYTEMGTDCEKQS